MGPRAGLDGQGKFSLLTRIRSPDRPARSESLYRLSYAGPQAQRSGFRKGFIEYVCQTVGQKDNLKHKWC
jgi:hypothetical protein